MTSNHFRWVSTVALLAGMLGFAGVAKADECSVNTHAITFNALVASVTSIVDLNAPNCVDFMITDRQASGFSPFTLTINDGRVGSAIMSDRLVMFYDAMGMPNICVSSLETANGGGCDVKGTNTVTLMAGDPGLETLTGNITDTVTGKVWTIQVTSHTVGLSSDTISFSSVPEPGTMLLLVLGLVGMLPKLRKTSALRE